MDKKLACRATGDYLISTLGTLILACSIYFFLSPNTIAPGGVTGLAIVIKRLTSIEVYVTNLAINLPLFIIGIISLGKTFGVKTAYGTFTLSFFLYILSKGFGNFYMTQDILLASIYGGVLNGIGLGLVFRSGGTTGGTDLAGAILNKFIPGFSIPKMMMFIDLSVVIIAGIVNRNVETSLYSIICLFTVVKVADFVIDGMNYSKVFHIITDYPEEISKKIIEEIDRGVTALKGKGMYTGKEKEVLMCVVDRAQVTKLKHIVHEIDKNAFIMVNTIHEVLGEGFNNKRK